MSAYIRDIPTELPLSMVIDMERRIEAIFRVAEQKDLFDDYDELNLDRIANLFGFETYLEKLNGEAGYILVNDGLKRIVTEESLIQIEQRVNIGAMLCRYLYEAEPGKNFFSDWLYEEFDAVFGALLATLNAGFLQFVNISVPGDKEKITIVIRIESDTPGEGYERI